MMFINNMRGLGLPLLSLSVLFSPLASAQSSSTTAIPISSVSMSSPLVASVLAPSDVPCPVSTSWGPNGPVIISMPTIVPTQTSGPVGSLTESSIPIIPITGTIQTLTPLPLPLTSESPLPVVQGNSTAVVVSATVPVPVNATATVTTTTASSTSVAPVTSTEALTTAISTSTSADTTATSLLVVTSSGLHTTTAASSNATASPTSGAISNRFHRETALASLAVGIAATVVMATFMA